MLLMHRGVGTCDLARRRRCVCGHFRDRLLALRVELRPILLLLLLLLLAPLLFTDPFAVRLDACQDLQAMLVQLHASHRIETMPGKAEVVV